MPKQGRLLIRVFMTFFVTALLILASFAGVAHWLRGDPAMPPLIARHLAQYGRHLMDQLGSPPSASNADRLSKELGMVIEYSAAATGEGAKTSGSHDLSVFENRGQRIAPDVRAGRRRGAWFLLVERNGVQALFSIGDLGPDRPERALLLLAGAILFFLVLSFMTIRMMLQPVKTLMSAVERIASGDLNYRVEVKNRTEFAAVAQAFNQMAERISEMVRSRERLLMDVSHELRSPLTRLKVATTMLDDSTLDPALTSSLREQIQGDCSEMETLVNDTLESFRIRSTHGALKRVKTDLRELVENVVSDYSKQPPGVQIQISAEPCEAEIDPMRMERVLRNLLENAIKYSTESPLPSVPPVVVTLERRAGRLELIVADSGVGIAPGDLKNVFEPFYRADRSRNRRTGGFGLGLSICRDIVQAHGGTIAIRSEQGKGTTVIVTI